MISRVNSETFFSKNWHYMASAAAVVAFVGAIAYFSTTSSVDPTEEAASTVNSFDSVRRKTSTGVASLDMSHYTRALNFFEKPLEMADVDSKKSSFLMPAPRVYCDSCEEPVRENQEKCQYCGYQKPKEKAVPLDSDGDTMPNDYELKYGLDPNNDDRHLDKDADGFTNYEEFLANTDPANRRSHTPYIECLQLDLPLEEEKLKFYLEKVQPLPGGKHRFYFRDFSQKDAYGLKGKTLRPLMDEEIGSSGYVVKSFEMKKKEKVIKGSGGLKKEVDVSEVKIERKSDKKVITLILGERNKAVDTKANLVYTRGTVQRFTVVQGSVIELNGDKHKVKAINKLKNGAQVVLEDVLTGKIDSVKTLESEAK
jgi:hypothetical protein